MPNKDGKDTGHSDSRKVGPEYFGRNFTPAQGGQHPNYQAPWSRYPNTGGLVTGGVDNGGPAWHTGPNGESAQDYQRSADVANRNRQNNG